MPAFNAEQRVSETRHEGWEDELAKPKKLERYLEAARLMDDIVAEKKRSLEMAKTLVTDGNVDEALTMTYLAGFRAGVTTKNIGKVLS
jgi:hypothetical protein